MRRETFKTSRLLDHFTTEGLTKQVGHPPSEWPLVIVKELVDNGLDIAEEHGIAPEITIKIEVDSITVVDNGPGIPPDTIDTILDLSSRTSSRAGYVSPTRGQQGNALATLFSMPYVLGGEAGLVVVEACGVRHEIQAVINRVEGRPEFVNAQSKSLVQTGTRILLSWPTVTADPPSDLAGEIIQVAVAFVWANPGIALHLDISGEPRRSWLPTAPSQRKWLPSHPTSPHWYTAETLGRLICACVAKDRRAGRVRPVREFLTDFAGLKRTAAQKEVLAAVGLSREPMTALLRAGEKDFDPERVLALLEAMKSVSRPIDPRTLGVIGRKHLAARMMEEGAAGETFQYKAVCEVDEDGVPFVVEAAFAWCPKLEGRVGLMGINSSAAIGDPFPGNIASLLEQQCVGYSERAILFLHMVTPRARFTDLGKAHIALSASAAYAMNVAIEHVTQKWARERRKEDRRLDAAANKQAREEHRELVEAERREAKADRDEAKRAKARQGYILDFNPAEPLRLPTPGRGNHTHGENAQARLREWRRQWALEVTKLIKNVDEAFRPTVRGICYLIEGTGAITKKRFDAVEGMLTQCRVEGSLDLYIVSPDEKRAVIGEIPVEASDPIATVISEAAEEIVDHVLDTMPEQARSTVEKASDARARAANEAVTILRGAAQTRDDALTAAGLAKKKRVAAAKAVYLKEREAAAHECERDTSKAHQQFNNAAPRYGLEIASIAARHRLDLQALNRLEVEQQRYIEQKVLDFDPPLDRFTARPAYIELAVEKRDLLELWLAQCRRYRIPVTNWQGQADLISMVEMMKRFKAAHDRGQRCVLIYAGDLDPHGVQISDNLPKRFTELQHLVGQGFDASFIEVDRFALNLATVEALELPWIRGIETSSGGDLADESHRQGRSEFVTRYKEKIGARKVEANALIARPDAGRALFDEVVRKYIIIVEEEAETAYQTALREKRDELRAEIKRQLAEREERGDAKLS